MEIQYLPPWNLPGVGYRSVKEWTAVKIMKMEEKAKINNFHKLANKIIETNLVKKFYCSCQAAFLPRWNLVELWRRTNMKLNRYQMDHFEMLEFFFLQVFIPGQMDRFQFKFQFYLVDRSLAVLPGPIRSILGTKYSYQLYC